MTAPEPYTSAMFTRFLKAALIAMGFLSIGGLYGQHPEVHEEPYHRPFYQWDCLRFLQVKASPGDTTAYHIHRNPILYICLEGAELWLDDAGREPRVLELAKGWVGSNTYGGQDTLLHRFAVRGSSDLRILAVERTGLCTTYATPGDLPFYSRDGFRLYAIDRQTYISREYYAQYPAIIPPGPIRYGENAVSYAAGHIIKPYTRRDGYAPIPGVEVLWLLLPE